MAVETATYRKDKRSMIAWAGGIVGTLAGLSILGAHAMLWAHDGEIRTLKTRQEADREAAANQESRTEKALDRLDSKLDRLLEKAGAK